MQAHALDPELARALQHRVRDLLVVHEPPAVEALGRGAGVALPRVHLEGRGLLVHEVEIDLAELGGDEPVGEHPLGLGDPVDLVADVRHLLRRHHRLLWIRARRRGDEPDVGLAVEEHLLDHVRPRQIRQGAAVGGQLRVQALRALAQPEEGLLAHRAPSAGLLVARIVARAHVVELHVEDEVGIAAPLLERGGIGRLDRPDVEEPAEDRVHRQQRRGHAAAAAQELAATQAEPRREPRGLGEDPVLDPALRGRLGQGRELLVRDEARRERRLGAEAAAHAGQESERVAIVDRHDRGLLLTESRPGGGLVNPGSGRVLFDRGGAP